MNNKKKLNNFSREEIVDIVKNTNSSAAACRKLGYSVKSASCTTRLRKYLNNLNIDFSHWTGQLWSKGKTILTDERVSKKRKIEEMFVENSEVPRSYIRNLILKNNLLEYKCKLCNILPFWNNQELVFHLDHINGIRNDHRLENLRWLCPNCHSQTDTYCGKRNTGKTKISDEDLLKSYEKTKNVDKALKELGLASSGNIKRLKKLINKGM